MDEAKSDAPRQVPGTGIELSGPEITAYKTASEAIQLDLSRISSLREQVTRLEQVHWHKPDSKPYARVATAEGEWDVHAQLFKFPRSEINLCRQGDTWAVVQEFKGLSSYAQAKGQTDILLKGQNAPGLMNEYLGQIEHTMRFMARNAAAHAQRVVWEQFPDHNPIQVIRALSEKCAQAVEKPESYHQAEKERPAIKQSRGMSI
jgi:hypothetical protein